MSVQTRERTEAQRQKLDDVLVVDTDVHVYELPKDLIDYIDMPWQVALEQVKDRTGNFIPAFAPGASGFSFGPIWPTSHESDRIVRTPEAMREELSNINIDIGILFPEQPAPLRADPEHRVRHRTLAGLQPLAAGRVAAGASRASTACCSPARRTRRTPAAEIRQLRQGRRGSSASTCRRRASTRSGATASTTRSSRRRRRPICRSACTASTVVTPAFPCQLDQFENHFARQVLSHSFAMMANLTSLIHTGVPARFPKLRVVFTEAGIAWVPYMMWRMDKYYHEYRRDGPLPGETPQRLHDRSGCGSPRSRSRNPTTRATSSPLIDLYRRDRRRILFASDWPHHDFDHPNKIFQAPFSDDVKRKIFGENALRLLNLDANGQRIGLSPATP